MQALKLIKPMLKSKLLHQLSPGFKSVTKDRVSAYKSLLNNEAIGVWEYDFKNKEITFCDVSKIIYGVSHEVVSLNDWLLVLCKSSTTKLVDFLNKVDIRTRNKELTLNLSSGQEILLKATPILNPSKKNVEFFLGTVSFKSSIGNSAFLNEINNSSKAVALLDAEMRYIAFSTEWLSVYDINQSDIKNELHSDICSVEVETFKNNFKESLNGVLVANESSFLAKEGTVKWLKQEMKPWYVDTGKVGGVIIYTDVVTQTKVNISSTVNGKFGLTSDTDDVDSGIAIFSSKGNCIKVNKNLSDILGYSEAEIKELYFESITHPADKHIIRQIISQFDSSSETSFNVEKRYISITGETIYAMVSIELKDIKGVPVHYVATITDITKKIATNKQIRLAYAEMEAIFSASSKVIIMVTDANGIIKQFNKGAEHLLGYKKEEIISRKNPTLFHCDIDFGNKSQSLSNTLNKKVEGFRVFTELAKSSKQTNEWIYQHKNGDCFPVQLTFDTIRDDQGAVIGYLGVGHDISKIKNHENKIQNLLEVSKAQNKRLLNFAHIVSHNLKSHSGNFSMLLNLLKEEHQDIGDNEIVKMLNQASSNLSETISHLNEVVQLNTNSVDNLASVNLNQALEKVIGNVLGIALTSGVEIVNQADKNLEVLCIPAYLESILLNFLTNGVKYKSENRKSFVKFTTLVDNKHIILSIEDNGLGIDLNKHQNKLFGMYKTFHNHEDSRGLGLFIAKNQIEAIGGKVEVTSKVNVGTIFKVYFKYEEN